MVHIIYVFADYEWIMLQRLRSAYQNELPLVQRLRITSTLSAMQTDHAIRTRSQLESILSFLQAVGAISKNMTNFNEALDDQISTTTKPEANDLSEANEVARLIEILRYYRQLALEKTAKPHKSKSKL